MTPYLLYYLYSLFLLLIDKKLIPILFSLGWFLFVGFRDGIGTDYYPVMISFERNYIDFQDIEAAFKGYALVDMELLFKIIATFFHYLNLDMIGIHIVVSFIESILIYLLLKKIKHKKLLMLYFVTLFTLNYPMNITRNGLSLLILIFAVNYFRNDKGKRLFFTVISTLTHYSSIPIILLTSIRIKKVSTIIIAFSVISLLSYFFINLISLRYPIDDISGFEFKGYGIRLALGTILMLIINYFVVERKFLKQENVFLIMIMVVTFLFNPFMRYNMFYTTFILFSNIFFIDNRKISPISMLLLFSMPVLIMFSEWLEISRYETCLGCGSWLPYKSLF
jgi:hypothetical protein